MATLKGSQKKYPFTDQSFFSLFLLHTYDAVLGFILFRVSFSLPEYRVLFESETVSLTYPDWVIPGQIMSDFPQR